MRRRLAALCGLLLCACAACSEPPQKEINRAQGALDAARAAGAEQYAPEPFQAASAAMRETHAAVEDRDYRLALSRAIDANERALEAATEAANGKARARGEAEAALGLGSTALRQLQERLKAAEWARLTPRETEAARTAAAAAEAQLQEARAAIDAGRFTAAADEARAVASRITEELRALSEAIDARAARGPRRRR